jgi:hypothetical protein
MSSAPTPQQKNNQVVWWIVGIIGGGIALLVVLGLIVAGVIVRHLNVKQNGDKVEIETPVGSIRVNSDDAHSTGLPIYPGATRAKSDAANVELASKDGDAVGFGIEAYSTPDNLDKVSAWYVQKLGPGFHREKPGDESHRVHGKGSDSADIVYVNEGRDGARIVALTAKSPGVEIALIRAEKKEVQ